MGIRDWFSGFKKTEAKSYQLVIQVGEDGFIPAAQFEGSDLYQLYTQAVWTYICVHRISQDLQNLPAVVQRFDPVRKEWVPDPEHALNDLLVRPYGTGSNVPRWSWQQQIAAGAIRMELIGNQYYSIITAGGDVTALGLILNDVKGIEDERGVPTRYSIGNGGAEVSADKLVNVMHAAPDSWWRGVAPIVAAQQAIRVDYSASHRIRYDLEHRISPGVVFKVRSLFAMDEDRKTEAKAWLTAQFEGAANAGKSMVVGDDVTVDAPPLRQLDDLPTHHANARDAIISSHDVSPPVVGVLDDVKYQNWDKALEAQWAECIEPRARNLYTTINGQAIWPVYGRGVRLWYNPVLSSLGRAGVREIGASAKVYFDLGYPVNALNAHFGFGLPMFDELERPNQKSVVAGREPEPEVEVEVEEQE